MVPTGSLLWSPHGPHVLHHWSPLGPHLVHTWSPPGRHVSPVRGPCVNHVGDPVVTRWTRCEPGGVPRGARVWTRLLVTTWSPPGFSFVPTWSLGPRLVLTRSPPRPHLVPTWSPLGPRGNPDGTRPGTGGEQATHVQTCGAATASPRLLPGSSGSSTRTIRTQLQRHGPCEGSVRQWTFFFCKGISSATRKTRRLMSLWRHPLLLQCRARCRGVSWAR